MIRVARVSQVTLQVVGALLLAGCAHHYKAERQLHMQGLLQVGATAYLPQPAPADAGKYPQSGEQTAAAIRDAFSRNGAQLEIGPSDPDAKSALARARERKAKYLVLASVDHWEDHPTEWTGEPDRIEVRIHVVDTALGQPIDSTKISGTSRWGTLGGDHPQDLLARPIDDYVTSLFLGREVEK